MRKESEAGRLMTPWMSSRCLSLLSIGSARRWEIGLMTALAFLSSALGVQCQKTCGYSIGLAVAFGSFLPAIGSFVEFVSQQKLAIGSIVNSVAGIGYSAVRCVPQPTFPNAPTMLMEWWSGLYVLFMHSS